MPLIRRQLIALSGAGVDEVGVVLGHHADVIEAAVRDFPVTLARNPSPDDGQASSVRIGLQALSPKLDAVIVALADQPMINGQDITALIGAFKKRGDASMVVPRVAGEPGNPVIFESALRGRRCERSLPSLARCPSGARALVRLRQQPLPGRHRHPRGSPGFHRAHGPRTALAHRTRRRLIQRRWWVGASSYTGVERPSMRAFNCSDRNCE